jgi:hypothetical protein
MHTSTSLNSSLVLVQSSPVLIASNTVRLAISSKTNTYAKSDQQSQAFSLCQGLMQKLV